MLSLLWWLPLAVAAAGLVPIWRGGRALAAEEAALRTSIAELRRVRPLVHQVRAEIAAVDVSRGVHDLGPR